MEETSKNSLKSESRFKEWINRRLLRPPHFASEKLWGIRLKSLWYHIAASVSSNTINPVLLNYATY